MDAATIANAKATETAKVDIRGLSFFYGASKALNNISLPLRDRKVTAFIGPSGCGKSTLLYILGAMARLTHGRALVCGQDIGNMTDRQLAAKVRQYFAKSMETNSVAPKKKAKAKSRQRRKKTSM